MRRAKRVLPVLLILGVAGCGRSGQGEPRAPDPGAIADELGRQIETDLRGAIEREPSKIDAREVVVYVLDPAEGADEEIRNQLRSFLPEGTSSWLSRARPLEDNGQDLVDLHVREYRMAPVEDLAGLARGVTFGAVLAVDNPGREILVRHGAIPSPAGTWGGAKEISAHLEESARDSICDFLARQGENLLEHLAKTHDRETIAYVIFEGARGGPPSDEFGNGLRRATEGLGVEAATSGWYYTDDEAQIAMVTGRDLSAFADAVDFARVRLLDPERRLIVFEYKRPSNGPEGAGTRSENVCKKRSYEDLIRRSIM